MVTGYNLQYRPCRKYPVRLSLLVILAVCAGGCREGGGSATAKLRSVSGSGRFWEYAPPGAAARGPVLVIAHGMLGRGQRAVPLARRFLERWVPLARRHGVVLVAPAFDQAGFGGRAGPGGGYRGLFGREMGADVFVERAVADVARRRGARGDRFLLYGHSAGGQFASRYLVRHPDRLLAVVLSAPGKFPFPDPAAPWPNGLGRLRRNMRWPGRSPSRVDISPDPATWARAASLPVTVVVGSRDTRPQNSPPGQQGSNRLERARAWVAEMNRFARGRQGKGRLRLEVVRGVGHSSAGLTPRCAAALVRHLP